VKCIQVVHSVFFYGLFTSAILEDFFYGLFYLCNFGRQHIDNIRVAQFVAVELEFEAVIMLPEIMVISATEIKLVMHFVGKVITLKT